MTDRWGWWALGLSALLVGCADVSAGDATQPDGSVAVELGPLPTRTTVARAEPTPTTTSRPTTTLASPTTTSKPATSTSSSSPPATTTSPRQATVDTSKTSCTRVAYIGDSVSLGTVPSEEMPDPPARLDLRLAQLGVVDLRVEVSGGRSIVETLPGQENAHDVAVRLRNDGFSGCWVIAVGTNDAANIAAGGKRQATERITSLMSVIGTEPTLWIDAATIAVDGYWASPNMQAWNNVLLALAPTYSNLRVAPWSTFVGAQWYQPDGVHLSDAGSTARVEFIASALVAAFPRR